MGLALRYTQGQWEALTHFHEDASLLLGNNASERALRAMALGRKNAPFVGSDEANGVKPEASLADVLLRLGTSARYASGLTWLASQVATKRSSAMRA